MSRSECDVCVLYEIYPHVCWCKEMSVCTYDNGNNAG
jgi:hypothetical protein